MVRSPASVSGALGSKVSLSCEAEGNPPPTYSWEADGGRGLVGTSSSLNFTLNQASVGAYHCTATGAGGKEVVSSKASVTLASAPSLSLPGLVTGEEGGEVQLVCSVDAEQLHMGLAWHRTGTPLRFDEHHHLETVVDGDQITTHLTISNLKEADFGFYSCVAAWEGGQVEEQVQVVRGSQAELVIIQVLSAILSMEAKHFTIAGGAHESGSSSVCALHCCCLQIRPRNAKNTSQKRRRGPQGEVRKTMFGRIFNFVVQVSHLRRAQCPGTKNSFANSDHGREGGEEGEPGAGAAEHQQGLRSLLWKPTPQLPPSTGRTIISYDTRKRRT